jgi:hypothetical protein
MPLEICQADRVLNAQPLPCDSCTKRHSCLAFTAWRQLFETPDPAHYKKHLISACSGYANRLGEGKPAGANIRPSLSANRVSHLCRGCPEDEKGSCRTHASLDEIRRAADAGGLTLAFTVYACKTKGGLVQIGQR